MEISNTEQLKSAFQELDALIAESFQGDSAKETRFLTLSTAIENYEDRLQMMPLPPTTLAGMIELRMFERRMKQKELAQQLGITPTRLNEVLRGKRKVNLDLAKRLHQKLNISAEFILAHA
jgi:HTH-type transcriptional regulator / antitoxin HigA